MRAEQSYIVQPKVISKSFSFNCPPDKSLTHRAVIFSSISKGESTIVEPLLGADCLATIKIFKQLGVQFTFTKDDRQRDIIHVQSPGWESFKNPQVFLDCENSGTTARLLTGLFASMPQLTVELTGDASLCKRPMARLIEPLRRAGAEISFLKQEGLLPIRIQGQKLKFDGLVEIDKASAQLKSGLLLAAMISDTPIEIKLPQGARDHTEKMLQNLGGELAISQSADGFEHINFKPQITLKPQTYKVPGDPSSAAFFAAFAALFKGVKVEVQNVLLNKTRTGFFRALEQMGVVVTVKDRLNDYLEETGNVEFVLDKPLKPIHLTKDEVPTLIDEIPILSIVALFAQGESSFFGVEELRVKESDRLAMIEQLILKAGGKIRISGENFYVQGGLSAFVGYKFSPAYDHRMFMTASILALFAEGSCYITEPDCVAVSFPRFFELFESLV